VKSGLKNASTCAFGVREGACEKWQGAQHEHNQRKCIFDKNLGFLSSRLQTELLFHRCWSDILNALDKLLQCLSSIVANSQQKQRGSQSHDLLQAMKQRVHKVLLFYP
jgi:hypothetical protein